jgi:hypothetical protein
MSPTLRLPVLLTQVKSNDYQFAHDKPERASSNSLVSKESGKKDMIPSSEGEEGVLVDFLYQVKDRADPFAETFQSKVEEYREQVKAVGTCPTVENKNSFFLLCEVMLMMMGDSVSSEKPMTTDYHFVVWFGKDRPTSFPPLWRVRKAVPEVSVDVDMNCIQNEMFGREGFEPMDF